MEFPFNCDLALGSDSEGYAIIDGKKLKKLLPHGQAGQIIDALGFLSAKVTLAAHFTRLVTRIEGGYYDNCKGPRNGVSRLYKDGRK